MGARRNSQGEKKNPSLTDGPLGGWSGDVELNSITDPVRIRQEDVASFTVSIKEVTGNDRLLCTASDP